MSAPAAVIFDFDGTLAETREAVSTTVNEALASHGLPRVAPSWIWGSMGLPLETLLERCIPPTRRPADIASLVAFYRDHFDRLGAPLVTPLEGAVHAVETLRSRGVKVGIATSRGRVSLDRLLPGLGLDGAFDGIATCDSVERGKPFPDMLLLVLRELGVAPDAAWMVGDTTFDVEMARAAGCRAVGVPHGSHPSDWLEEAGAEVVPDFTTLLTWCDA